MGAHEQPQPCDYLGNAAPVVCEPPGGSGRMAEDSQVPALPRRVPRDKQEPTTGRPAAQLPQSVVQRILSGLDDMRAGASPQDRKVQAEQPPQHHAAPSERPPTPPAPNPGT